MIQEKYKYIAGLVVAFILSLIMAINIWSDLRVFENNSPYVTITGYVSKLECQNHGNYFATFAADGIQYTEKPGNLYLKANCGTLSLNDEITIWVSQQNHHFISFIPPESAIRYMHKELRGIMTIGFPFMAIFFTLIRWMETKMKKKV